MGSMALNLHPIEEQESDIENGSDEELNRSYDLLMGVNRSTLKSQNDKETNKSMNLNTTRIPHSENVSPKKTQKLSVGIPNMDTSKLKHFIKTTQKEQLSSTRGPHKSNQKDHMDSSQDFDGNFDIKDAYDTPRFDREEEKTPEKQSRRAARQQAESLEEDSSNNQIEDDFKQVKVESSNIQELMNLDDSALLDISSEMTKNLKGLLNGNEESIMDHSLNTSNIGGGHKRQYSIDTSILFGGKEGNDTLTEDKSLLFDSSNILDLKSLIEDAEEVKEPPKEKPTFDAKKREEQLRKMFEGKTSPQEETSSRNVVWGLRNDTNPESENTNEQLKSQDDDNGFFNPFKQPVVPEVVGTPSNSDSQKDSPKSKIDSNKSHTVSSENKTENTGLKVISDQYEEWNKRMKEARKDNYFDDSSTKIHRKKPMNPLDKLTPAGMRDDREHMKHETEETKQSSNTATILRSSSDIQVLGVQDLEVANQQPPAIFTSFANTSESSSTPTEDSQTKKEIMKMEIILIIINCDLVSDFEVSRSKKYLKDFLNKNPELYEVHYGLSQVYFSLGSYHSALDEINIAMTQNKNDLQYLTWKALYLYYIFKTIMDKNKRIEALRK